MNICVGISLKKIEDKLLTPSDNASLILILIYVECRLTVFLFIRLSRVFMAPVQGRSAPRCSLGAPKLSALLVTRNILANQRRRGASKFRLDTFVLLTE